MKTHNPGKSGQQKVFTDFIPNNPSVITWVNPKTNVMGQTLDLGVFNKGKPTSLNFNLLTKSGDKLGSSVLDTYELLDLKDPAK